MFKEKVISIIIISGIFIMNNITENYTKQILEEMENKFVEIREELIKENEQPKQLLTEQVDEIMADWDKYTKKLAYYIEHDELEKVDTYLVSLKANVEMEYYELAVENLDVCQYILDHIDDKGAFMLRNVF